MGKPEIIKFLKAYKHTPNQVITYTTMNNIKNSSSLSDEQNTISQAIKAKDTKFIVEMIEAIFNVNDVVYDQKTKEYIIIEKSGNNVSLSKVKIQEQNGKIIFDVLGDTRKQNIVFETPEVIEKDFKKIKQDIIKELQGESISSKKDFEDFIKNILNTKF